MFDLGGSLIYCEKHSENIDLIKEKTKDSQKIRNSLAMRLDRFAAVLAQNTSKPTTKCCWFLLVLLGSITYVIRV